MTEGGQWQPGSAAPILENVRHPALDLNLSSRRGQRSDQRPEQGGLAGAVRSHDGRRTARSEGERDPVEDRFPVVGDPKVGDIDR
jgi:hypothetical protein